MKGLDWFKVVSNIAFDDDLEHRSDAAFRTFFELIGISAFDLSDGRVSLERARKLCNSPVFESALDELSCEKYLKIADTFLTLNRYKSYQQSKRETQSMRAKNRGYVRSYRERSKTNVSEQSRVEKSKSRKAIVAIEDTLLDFALNEIPASDSTAEDYAKIINKHRARLSDARIERVISNLAGWQFPSKRKKYHLTLNAWLLKEAPEEATPQTSTADDELDALCNMN